MPVATSHSQFVKETNGELQLVCTGIILHDEEQSNIVVGDCRGHELHFSWLNQQ